MGETHRVGSYLLGLESAEEQDIRALSLHGQGGHRLPVSRERVSGDTKPATLTLALPTSGPIR